LPKAASTYESQISAQGNPNDSGFESGALDPVICSLIIVLVLIIMQIMELFSTKVPSAIKSGFRAAEAARV
jgi:hypothetical protein